MNATGLFLLEDIYTRMQEAGLVTSKAEFSQRFLGKGASYLTSMRSRQRHVPDDVFALLIERLEAEITGSAQWIAEWDEKLRLEMARQHHRAELLRKVRQYQSGNELSSTERLPSRSLLADIRRVLGMTGHDRFGAMNRQ